MPKRSNLFQRTVEALYAAMTPVGGTVTESAEILESTSGIKREVDILAESRVFGATVRIAVEVRGRAKKDDVQWIDGLIGKFRDLPVDKVVAVSSSGFSSAACEKARAANIELLAAKDVPHRDWPSEFLRLGLASLRRKDHVDVRFETEPSANDQITRESAVQDEHGNDLATVGELVERLAADHRSWLAGELRTNLHTYYKTVADLRQTLVVERSVRLATPTCIRTHNGLLAKIQAVRLRSASVHEVEKVQVKHFAIASNLVSVAEVLGSDGTLTEVFASQLHDSPDQVTIRHRRVPAPSEGKRATVSTEGTARQRGKVRLTRGSI